LQKEIDAGNIKAVIVYQVDRLSRDIVDLLTTVRKWLQAGVEIYALDMGRITSENDIMLVIKGWQGSDERQKIRERTMRGKSAKAKSGKVVGEGVPPYGYTSQDGELIVNEEQAQVIKMIYEWYINGDKHGKIMSMMNIARELTALGIPTPAVSKGMNWRANKYGIWHFVTVRWILSSETYCGVLRWGRRVSRGGRLENRSAEEQIPIEVPAIISRESWELAQERRVYNSRIARRRMKREYLLRGMLFCGCGRRMVGTKSRYICTRRNDYFGERKCQEKPIPGALIEDVTWDYILGLIQNLEEFEEKLRQAQAKEVASVQPKQEELEHLNAVLREIETEADEIARASTKAQGIMATKLERQGDEVNKRYDAFSKRKSELENAMAVELTDDVINDLLKFREAVARGIENPTFDDRRYWLDMLQATVTVTDGIAVVNCRLGGTPLRYNLFEILSLEFERK
jgi:site-specific DNA recombinase